MTGYAQGDDRAFERLYARHRGALYRFFLRQLPDSANDCYQETWLKLIRARHAYTASGSFRAWLFTLAHNVLTDRFRKQMRAPEASETDPDDIADGHAIDDTVERLRLIRALHVALVKLPLHQREAWLMKQEAGLSLKEIADVTGTSEEGVKSRLRYANAKLRAGMARYVDA